MTIKHLFPPQLPSLNLDFANQRSLSPLITFSRSSIGTYTDEDGIVRTAQQDEPRFDFDPDTGESLGLLIEEARTNSQIWSNDLSKSPQYNDNVTGGDGVSPVLDSTLYEAPDGTLTAQKWTFQITNTTSSANYSVIQASNSGIPANAAVSVFVKSATGSDQIIYMNADSGVTDTHTVTDKWQRFELGNFNVIPFRVGARGNVSGASVEILIWGVQMEDGEFSTSYILTSGSQASRSADLATIEGSNNIDGWYNPKAGTWFGQAIQIPFGVVTSGAPQLTVFSMNNYREPEFTFRGDQANASVYDSQTGAIIKPYTKPWTYFGWAGESTVGATGAINGQMRAVANPHTLTNTRAEKFWIGAYLGSGSYRYAGHIARLTYWPLRLPDEQLVALTS